MARPKPAQTPAPMLRRAPSQKRSRERVERILAEAESLIAGRGSDALRMSEIASRSGISIGSLYQYFPDKAAILCSLADRYNTDGCARFAEGLAVVRNLKELHIAFDALVDDYYATMRAEPVACDVWSGTQADKALQAVGLQHSRRFGDQLTEALLRLWPKADAAAVSTRAFLLTHLGEATIRLAIAVKPREGLALVEAYKSMAAREFADIAAELRKRRTA